MELIDIKYFYDSGNYTKTIEPGDTFLLGRPNSQRGDKYSVLAIDQKDLISEISNKIPFNSGVIKLLGSLIGADMNLLGGIYPGGADQVVILSGGTKFVISEILMMNPSVPLANASDAQFWTEANQGGNIIFIGSGYPQPARGGEYLRKIAPDKVLSFNDIWVSAYVTDPFVLPDLFRPIAGNKIYFSLDGAEGVPATADIYVYGYILE